MHAQNQGRLLCLYPTNNPSLPPPAPAPQAPLTILLISTFDDGPWYYTAALLDLLKQKSVKATFFITSVPFTVCHISPETR